MRFENTRPNIIVVFKIETVTLVKNYFNPVKKFEIVNVQKKILNGKVKFFSNYK